MKAAVLAIGILILASEALMFRQQMTYAFLYPKDYVWHRLTTKCRMVTEFEAVSRVLSEVKPIGLTRAQCLKALGRPDSVYPGILDKVTDKSLSQAEWWNYHNKGSGALELKFDGEFCKSCRISYTPCRECLTHYFGNRPMWNHIERDFAAVSHSQALKEPRP